MSTVEIHYSPVSSNNIDRVVLMCTRVLPHLYFDREDSWVISSNRVKLARKKNENYMLKKSSTAKRCATTDSFK
jgi:hypothetical protein